MCASLASSYGTTLCFLNLYVYFFHQVKEVFCSYIFKYVFNPCFLSSPLSTHDVNVGMLELVPGPLLTILILFGFFFPFCCSDWMVFLPYLPNC